MESCTRSLTVSLLTLLFIRVLKAGGIAEWDMELVVFFSGIENKLFNNLLNFSSKLRFISIKLLIRKFDPSLQIKIPFFSYQFLFLSS